MKTDGDLNLTEYAITGFYDAFIKLEHIKWPEEFIEDDKLNFIDDLISRYEGNGEYDKCAILQTMKEGI